MTTPLPAEYAADRDAPSVSSWQQRQRAVTDGARRALRSALLTVFSWHQRYGTPATMRRILKQ